MNKKYTHVRVREFNRRIEQAEKHKEHLISYLQNLKDHYLDKKISYNEYQRILHEKRNGKSIKEWIEYYDEHIGECKNKIHSHTKTSLTKKISIIAICFLFFIFMIIITFKINISPHLIGKTVQDNNLVTQQAQEFTQDVSSQFTKNDNYIWKLDHLGNLQSLKISGKIKGNGIVRVYLNNNNLILDSTSITHANSITGNVIENLNSNLSTQENITQNSTTQTNGSVGNIISQTNFSSIPELGNSTPENVTQTENVTVRTNITTENTTTQQNTTNGNQEEKAFLYTCEETCDLSRLQLNNSEYILKIEVSDATFTLEKIKYKITSQIQNSQISQTNQTQNQSIQTNQTENITEKVNKPLEQIEINKLVKWKKQVSSNRPTAQVITLPSEAENIVLITVEGNQKKEIHSSVQKKIIKNQGKDREITEITPSEAAKDFEVNYETPAPTIQEKESTKNRKRVVVSGIDELNYTNVLTYMNIPEIIKVGDENSIKLHWIEEDSYISFKALDTNKNGLIDRIEWITPHLSNQTFEIILISKAEHLDSNKTFISDIYDETKDLDNLWSEEIPNTHYVRVTFEKNLTNKNDITIFPRITQGSPTIKVYEQDKNLILAEFDSIVSNSYNKIYLNNLSGSQDTFDLLVIGGSIQIDHIIDPTAQTIGGNVVLLPQSCNRDVNGGTSYKFPNSCQGSYPSNGTCATNSDRLSCNDAIEENSTFKNAKFGGINITVFNSSITNCGSVTQVFLCYERWVVGTGTLVNCNVTVSNSSNSANAHITINGTCPGTTGDPGEICQNVTSNRTWSCGNFFGSSGDRAQAAIEVGASSVATNNLSVDVLKFNVSYNLETVFPNISIAFPNNSTNFSTKSITINYTAQDMNLFNCWWTNDSSNTNNSLTNCGTNITSSIFGEGTNNITIFVNDTAGNINSTSVKFTVDTIFPLINFTNTTARNSTNQTLNWIHANATVTEVNEANITFSLYNTTTQVNVTTFTTATRSINWTGLNDALYFYNVTVRDIVNNTNTTETRTIRIDSFPPTFDHSISNFTINNGTSFNYDVNATDAGIGIQNFSVNDSKFFVNVTGWIRNVSALTIANYYLNLSVNDTLGNINSTVFYVNVTLNNPPNIVRVFNETFSSGITLNEMSNTNLTVNFTAFDADGAGNLDNSTATINITKTGEQARFNSTCLQVQASGNYANYSCKIMLWWYDVDGVWNINASISDLSATKASNGTANITMNALTGFVSGPVAMTFASITPGATNQTSNNDPIRLNNSGNQNIFAGGISINATNLKGETDSTKALYTGNFTVGNSTGGTNPECDLNGNTSAIMNITSGRFAPVNGTNLNATLMKGNFTKNDGTAQRDLYVCLTTAGSELSVQSYSTANQGAWTIKITVLAVGIIIKRKRKKNIKEDKLVKALILIKEELKENYSDAKAELMNLLLKEITKKYRIKRQEILEILEIKYQEEIPITIFNKDLGGLEVLCKYMKENLGMKYKEIGQILGRNERTIWTSYKKSQEKYKEPLQIRESKIKLSLKIFHNKKLTILESVILYLKSKGMKYTEIAKYLERDQRNVWTIYSRAVNKMK